MCELEKGGLKSRGTKVLPQRSMCFENDTHKGVYEGEYSEIGLTSTHLKTQFKFPHWFGVVLASEGTRLLFCPFFRNLSRAKRDSPSSCHPYSYALRKTSEPTRKISSIVATFTLTEARLLRHFRRILLKRN